MPPPDDIIRISADDRLAELASIFAAAILRLRDRAVLIHDAGRDQPPTCLEVPPETVLSGHHG